jgi:hypothetical protein
LKFASHGYSGLRAEGEQEVDKTGTKAGQMLDESWTATVRSALAKSKPPGLGMVSIRKLRSRRRARAVGQSQSPFRTTFGAHWFHNPPSILRTTSSRMNHAALPENRSGVRNKVGAFICSLRSWCPLLLKGLLELADTQPQKFEMRPVWGATQMNVRPGDMRNKMYLRHR